MRVDTELLELIRTVRREHAKLTQREAAELAGFSSVWWHRIESGGKSRVPADTIAKMCWVINVSPLWVTKWPELCDALERRRRFLSVSTEDHLAITPGVDARTRQALIRYVRTHRRPKDEAKASEVAV